MARRLGSPVSEQLSRTERVRQARQQELARVPTEVERARAFEVAKQQRATEQRRVLEEKEKYLQRELKELEQKRLSAGQAGESERAERYEEQIMKTREVLAGYRSAKSYATGQYTTQSLLTYAQKKATSELARVEARREQAKEFGVMVQELPQKKAELKEVYRKSVMLAPGVEPKLTTAYRNILTGEMISAKKPPSALYEKVKVTPKGETYREIFPKLYQPIEEPKPLYYTPIPETPIEKITAKYEITEEKVAKETTQKVLTKPWGELVGTEEQITKELARARVEWQEKTGIELKPFWAKAQEYYVGKLGGAYTIVREKPLKTGITIAVFAAMPATIKVGKLGFTKLAGLIPKIPVLTKVTSTAIKAGGVTIKYGLPAAYTASVGARIYTEPTPYTKGFKTGEILTGEIVPMVLGYKLGSYGLRRAELGLEYRKQIKELPKSQRELFLQLQKELRTTQFKKPIKELSLKGVERIPKRAKEPLTKFLMKQQDIIIGGSVAQQTQLQKQFTQTDIDIIAVSEVRAKTAAKETATFLRRIGIKRVSLPKSTEITIAGKKAIEYHPLETFFKPSVEKVLPWYKTYRSAIKKTPSGVKVMELKAQAERKLIGGVLKGERKSVDKMLRDLEHLERIAKEVFREPVKPKSLKRLKPLIKIPTISVVGVGEGAYPRYPAYPKYPFYPKGYPAYPIRKVPELYSTYPKISKGKPIKTPSLYPMKKLPTKIPSIIPPKTPSKYPLATSKYPIIPPTKVPPYYPPYKPPKEPPIEFPLLPPKFPKKKLKKKKKKLGKEFTYAPTFTEKALGIKPIKITTPQAEKLLKKELTGFELAPPVKLK